MIDIGKAIKEFDEYVKNFDINSFNIKMKIDHTKRVANICEKLSEKLGLNKEEIKLATLIGILHDIGRFEQYTIYKTFSDIYSIDHAEYGVKILEKDNYIRKYVQTEVYDDIIKKAIYNHNKYSVEEKLTQEERLFCNIIRDADKLDILYQSTFEFWDNEERHIELQTITPKVLEEFVSKRIIDRKDLNNDIDSIIVSIAFIYDFNFNQSYNIVKNNKYIEKIIDRFKYENIDTINQMKMVRRIALEHIKEVLDVK